MLGNDYSPRDREDSWTFKINIPLRVEIFYNESFFFSVTTEINYKCTNVKIKWNEKQHFFSRFLLQCLEDLDRSLRKLNSRLFVIRGQPADALPKLFKKWGTTSLTFEEDPEPYGRVRDENITTLCKELGISVVQRVSHTLYKLDEWVIFIAYIYFFCGFVL